MPDKSILRRLIQAVEIFVWFKTGVNPRYEDIKENKKVGRQGWELEDE